jgi:hypothetical protein
MPKGADIVCICDSLRGSWKIDSESPFRKSDCELVLTNGAYPCPDCRQMTLRFRVRPFSTDLPTAKNELVYAFLLRPKSPSAGPPAMPGPPSAYIPAQTGCMPPSIGRKGVTFINRYFMRCRCRGSPRPSKFLPLRKPSGMAIPVPDMRFSDPLPLEAPHQPYFGLWAIQV